MRHHFYCHLGLKGFIDMSSSQVIHNGDNIKITELRNSFSFHHHSESSRPFQHDECGAIWESSQHLVQLTFHVRDLMFDYLQYEIFVPTRRDSCLLSAPVSASVLIILQVDKAACTHCLLISDKILYT